jgi:hypothetical protein
MRSLGCRDLLVYCRSVECNHSITMNADHLPDDTLVRPLGDFMVCTTYRQHKIPQDILRRVG